MMPLSLCHAQNENELKTYTKIVSVPHLSVGFYNGSQDMRMKPFAHAHNHYEFIIPLETIPILRYEQANYPGEVGYCYPVNPHVEHGLRLSLTSELMSIAADEDYLNRRKAELGYEDKLFYTRFLINSGLLTELNLFGLTQSETIAAEIIDTLIRAGLQDDIDNRRPQADYFQDFKDVILFIFEHFTESSLTIRDISAVSRYGYTYFTKAFVKFMNETPVSYLNKVRISKAKAMMKDNLPFDSIAKQSGYTSASAFTEAFKRIVGMTPTEYKKKFF